MNDEELSPMPEPYTEEPQLVPGGVDALDEDPADAGLARDLNPDDNPAVDDVLPDEIAEPDEKPQAPEGEAEDKESDTPAAAPTPTDGPQRRPGGRGRLARASRLSTALADDRMPGRSAMRSDPPRSRCPANAQSAAARAGPAASRPARAALTTLAAVEHGLPDDLAPGEPYGVVSLDGGIEVALEVPVALLGGVVPQPAVQLDQPVRRTDHVAVDDARGRPGAQLRAGRAAAPWGRSTRVRKACSSTEQVPWATSPRTASRKIAPGRSVRGRRVPAACVRRWCGGPARLARSPRRRRSRPTSPSATSSAASS